ncbi:MAG: hypothetical protein DMF61_12810 [Blastocatellia bacterium AA13]|nr:MAG: hypothetical protein DMF61_12810 [Blastocatellia bacterium AA13]
MRVRASLSRVISARLARLAGLILLPLVLRATIPRASEGGFLLTDAISTRMLRRFLRQYTIHYPDLNSVDEICAFDDRILERTANVDSTLLTRRLVINNQIMRLLRKKSTSELAGYYLLYPINRECEMLIEDGRILKSSQITDDLICSGGARAASLYLSMVYGVDRISQGFLIHLLYKDIREIIRKNPDMRSLFVRPVTPAGFRAVEKHEFKKFREDSGIFRRLISL